MGKKGRPTKYKKKYCEMLVKHMASGLSFLSFAAVIGVAEDTIVEWSNRHNDFSVAKKEGFSKNRLFWERISILGYTKNRVTLSDGTEVVEKNPVNPTVFIFNMKNRFPKEWRDKQDVELSGAAPVTIIFEEK